MLNKLLSAFSSSKVYLEENKYSSSSYIEVMPSPDKVILPLQQHLGPILEPKVKQGDNVKEGQLIADSEAFISAKLHSPIDGKIIAIENRPTSLGINVRSIIIEAKDKNSAKGKDNKDKSSFPVLFKEHDLKISSEQIQSLVKEAGIVGLGGAMFPTHVKLSPPKDKKITTVILNCAECEPFLTCDHRIMIEAPKHVLYGLAFIMLAVKADNAIIAIEENKKDAVSLLKKNLFILKHNIFTKIKIKMLPSFYPQGAEKNLIHACTGKELPSGSLPHDLGMIVSNVHTSYAIYNSVVYKQPLTSRVITVSGDVKNRKNLLVKLGTSFQDIIDHCGGLSPGVEKVIAGGPMTGTSVSNLDVPIIKGTSGIIALHSVTEAIEENECIRCSRCINSCPMRLMPNHLHNFSKQKKYDRCKEYNISDCVECGLCSYVCPARLDHLRWIKLSKKLILLQSKK